MSMPMPIELVLAAHDFEIPCIMSIMHGCVETAAFLVEFGHVDGTPHCDQSARLPLCGPHTSAARVAAAGGPLMDFLGATPPPDCSICGGGVTVRSVRTVRGEMA